MKPRPGEAGCIPFRLGRSVLVEGTKMTVDSLGWDAGDRGDSDLHFGFRARLRARLTGTTEG